MEHFDSLSDLLGLSYPSDEDFILPDPILTPPQDRITFPNLMDVDPLIPQCPMGPAWGLAPPSPDMDPIAPSGPLLPGNQTLSPIQLQPIPLDPYYFDMPTFGPPNEISDWDELAKILNPPQAETKKP